MIEINLTLVVQAFHFVLAYVVLKKFLWRPVITCLEQDEAHAQGLSKKLEQQRDLVRQINEQKIQAWGQARAAFAKQTPAIPEQFDGKLAVVARAAQSPLEIDETAVGQMTAVVVERVRHG